MMKVAIHTLILITFCKQILCTRGAINRRDEENNSNHSEVDILILGAGYAGIGKSLKNCLIFYCYHIC